MHSSHTDLEKKVRYLPYEILKVGRDKGLTIEPLLSKLPEPQKESVMALTGEAVFVSRFHKAPHAEWLLIIRGLCWALSNIRMRVGETMMAWVGTMPVVPFFTNLHAGVPGFEEGDEAA